MRARRLLHETPSGSTWRPGLEQRRVNVDFPVWMIESLDREARRWGSPVSQSSRSGSPSASNAGIRPLRNREIAGALAWATDSISRAPGLARSG
jgi:hypothetical protein